MKKLIFCAACSVVIMFIAGAQSYTPEKNNPKIKVNPVVNIAAFALTWQMFAFSMEVLLKTQWIAMSVFPTYRWMPAGCCIGFYKNAGLPTHGDVYGGWESQGLSGHTLGHFLSACSMMYASTGDARFKTKVDSIVNELERCQQARKSGYVGAIPNGRFHFWKTGSRRY